MRVTRILIFVLLAASLAGAQATRTWVSGVGDDANPCSRTAPCKTWAGAISKTAPGGEIDAVTITKAITLDGGGGQVASTLVTGGVNGIVVAAGASDLVIIRNIRVNGVNGGSTLNGIRMISGKGLIVENCDVFGFGNNGIDIAVSAAAAVTVTNTSVEGSTQRGLSAISTAGANSIKVAIVNSNFEHNAHGVWADNGSQVTVTGSSASNNAGVGFISQATGGGQQGVMSVFNSTSSLNGVGMQAGGGAGSGFMKLGNNAIYQNSAGVVIGANGNCATFQQGGQGTNYNDGSGTCNTGTIATQ